MYTDGLPLTVESVLVQESTVLAAGMIPTVAEVFEKVEVSGTVSGDNAEGDYPYKIFRRMEKDVLVY